MDMNITDPGVDNRKSASRPCKRNSGFSLLELLVVMVVIGIIAAIAVAAVHRAHMKAHVSALVDEARVIYTAFNRYYLDHNRYPYATSNPKFQLDTFEPLRSNGYYRGNVTTRLQNAQADAYDSPDDMGSNREFWLVMTLEVDPRVQCLVVNSDDAPLTAGEWYDGVFIYKDGVLTPANEYEP